MWLLPDNTASKCLIINLFDAFSSLDFWPLIIFIGFEYSFHPVEKTSLSFNFALPPLLLLLSLFILEHSLPLPVETVVNVFKQIGRMNFQTIVSDEFTTLFFFDLLISQGFLFLLGDDYFKRNIPHDGK